MWPHDWLHGIRTNLFRGVSRKTTILLRSENMSLQKKILQYNVAHELEKGKFQNRNIELECQRVKDQIQILRLILLTNQTKLTICFATLHNTRTGKIQQSSPLSFQGLVGQKWSQFPSICQPTPKLQRFCWLQKGTSISSRLTRQVPLLSISSKTCFKVCTIDSWPQRQTPKWAGNAGRSHYWNKRKWLNKMLEQTWNCMKV